MHQIILEAPDHLSKSIKVKNILVGIINFIIAPWWALKRPVFLTPEYVSRMSTDYKRVYAHLPEGFVYQLLVILSVLLLISSMFLIKSKSTQRSRFFHIVYTTNIIILGGFIATYLVLLPASRSMSGYFANTNHLLYSTLTNVSGAGFLKYSNKTIVELLPLIYPRHDSFLLGFNLTFLAAIPFTLSFFGLTQKKHRNFYLMIILFCASAFLMDIMSAKRDGLALYRRYLIYSVPFYAMGVFVFIWLGFKAEWRKFFPMLHKIICICLLFVATLEISRNWWVFGVKGNVVAMAARDKTIVKNSGHKYTAFGMIRVHVPSFYRKVQAHLR